jgi:hypothetical protein
LQWAGAGSGWRGRRFGSHFSHFTVLGVTVLDCWYLVARMPHSSGNKPPCRKK